MVAFIVTILALLALRPLAVAVDLVDYPGGRKHHHGCVPLVGGLAMFLGIAVSLGFLDLLERLGPLVAAFGLLATVGLLDDRFDLSPWLRLPVHAAAATLLVFGTHTSITTLGDPFGMDLIGVHGVLSVGLAVLVIMAMINAFNMLDGMDGLAGSTALICGVALLILAQRAGLRDSSHVAGIIIAVSAGFLIFNAPLQCNQHLRCFMGDAGSTVLGAALAWLSLRVSQTGVSAAVSPVTVLWVVALPMYELIWSFSRRTLRGQSPFAADAEHFHHMVMKAGFSVRAAFLLFAVLVAILSTTGFMLEVADVADGVSLLFLALAGVIVIRMMYFAPRLAQMLPSFLQRFDRTARHSRQRTARENQGG
ncbi:MAG: MraY family glycosyltransferase [Steroidobacteraceae bacterium]